MKLAPLARYKAPRYPTEAILRENPAFLTALPERWRGNRLALGTLAGVLSLSAQWHALAEEKAAATGSNPRVAPLFVHGEGKGTYGCVIFNPPVFLSESEAREVIEAEAKKAGLLFPKAEAAHTLADVDIPITDIYDNIKEAQREVPKTRKGNLTLTGYNPKKRIGYVFISREELRDWKVTSEELKPPELDPTPDPETSKITKNADGTFTTGWKPRTVRSWSSISSVSRNDFQGTAKTLQASLAARKGEETLAVFYDPFVPPKEEFKEPFPRAADIHNVTDEEMKAIHAWWDKRNAPIKAASEGELRKQVRDFLAWLKAQGMI